jgi:hypothetical protein
MNGQLPAQRLKIQGQLPFLLQKGEEIIWAFQNVEYYEQVTRTVYSGVSHGASFRIAKGVYYRTGTFKGVPVKTQEMKPSGNGIFAISDKHIFFYSANKNFKTPIKKLVTITPFEDGIGFQKDGVSSKPQAMKGIDGWFSYNLICNLAQI